MNKNYNLFLDDFRDPIDSSYYLKNPIYVNLEWVVVRNYDSFVKHIEENGIPETISFDHDLAENVEIWEDIEEYYGIYVISSLGRVMRIKKNKGTSGNNILIPAKNESGLYVSLKNKGNNKRFQIHRLVAKAFIPNPLNKEQINHKDGNRWNNNVNNLEWVTPSENNQHAHNELIRNFTAYGENHANSSTISQYGMDNKLINVYGSVNEAGRQLNIQFTNIAKCARGERKTAGGFIWKYENNIPTINSKIKHITKANKKYSERFFIPDINVEKTGYDCAKWLIDYCIDNDLELPKKVLVHSMNPTGAENIKSLFNTYNKIYNNIDLNYFSFQ